MTTEPAAPQPEERPTFPHAAPSLPFPVVGVGGSAGGMEAFSRFLEALPPDPNMAFILVMHLDPHHESMLSTILSRITKLPVQEATDGMPVKPNHVYIIPPTSNVLLSDGHLQLRARSHGRAPNMPVDHLFRSLASSQRNRAIGVVLSGGGSDGTLGLQEISAEEGITFAQDELSAKHDGMPRSAVAAGCVDFVLPPEGIAQELLRIARHPLAQTDGEPATGDEKTVLNRIFALMRQSTGTDFSQYKQSTINRRIRRRIALRGLESLIDYLQFLEKTPAEVQALYQDFLIRVTSFFRDPAAFRALQETVFPRLIQNRPHEGPIRIWVAGCSTGEEVYSLAICLLEVLGDMASNTPIKFLATDISETVLEKARSGIYIENIEMDVSPDRLRRFFIRTDGHFQVSKTLRDMCVFSRHNLVRDPPFSKLDLISCRNLLIYLSLPLQKRVIPLFHYALKPEGFLFLGVSETIGGFHELFELINDKQKIYQRKQTTSPTLPYDFDLATGPESLIGAAEEKGGMPSIDVQKEADRLVLFRYGPPGVIVDENLNILQFRGYTEPYLTHQPGSASLNLFRLAREGLPMELRKAIEQAKAGKKPVRKDGLIVKQGNQFHTANLEVIPLRAASPRAPCLLVLFEEASPLVAPPAPAGGPADSESARAADQRIVALQQELDATREYLQSVVEEHEATTEELKSAHEEILSNNEELQSTNEELQSAKEEMQSANEELATVNEELKHRNMDLAKLNDDLVNLLSGMNIPLVTVGRDLRIRRMTPLAEKIFNLIPTDIGRSFADIRPNLEVPNLSQLVLEVIQNLVPKELEAHDHQGRWYLLRIRPYITLENKIDGASIVAMDIGQLKASLERAWRAENGQTAEATVQPAPTPARRVLVVDESAEAAQILAALLRSGGHEVRTAQGADAAVKAAAELRPEAVFLDIGQRGWQKLAERLRQSPDADGRVLVAVGGHGQVEDRQRWEEAGLKHHVMKPVSPETLQELLTRLPKEG